MWKDNLDEKMKEAYASIPWWLWAEALNLHWEYTWRDYTPAGKDVQSVLALFGIVLLCIPIKIFMNNSMDILSDNPNAPELTDEDFKP